MSPPDMPELFRVFGRIGLLSFGGPAAQISLMHRELVEEREWLDERRFLNALSFCMLLPGPEAMQLATYAGWRLRGVAGGLLAGMLFVLPGALVVLALAMIYARFGAMPLMQALFLGVKSAVLVIVAQALWRIGKKALKSRLHWGIAAAAFVAIFFLAVPFPLIVLLAGIAGYMLLSDGEIDAEARAAQVTGTPGLIALWLTIWLLPLVAVALIFGMEDVLTQIALLFSKLAIVTFGGAYAVLSYLAEEVTVARGWLTPNEMVDGLGLAETTPGPLILVTEFVGYLAAARAGGLWYGVLGALVCLWATFAPCFLWIFAGAPYVERLDSMPRLRCALAAITAAVVGVILNLALFFALHVLFGEVGMASFGPFRSWMPVFGSLDWRVPLLTALAAFLLLGLRTQVPQALGTAAVAGWMLSGMPL